MKTRFSRLSSYVLATVALLGVPTAALAVFDSGSQCGTEPVGASCLGAFNPTVTTVIDLPPDGILHYSTFNVPANITVSFKRNAANTPVTILASGNVTVAGTLWVGYSKAPTPSGQSTADGGLLGDDGQPGIGGPGGFDGGAGGLSPLFGGTALVGGGAGKGPGGGQTGTGSWSNQGLIGMSGGGGAFAAAANGGYYPAASGTPYGQATLLPLIGGSGGGGGAAGTAFTGGGGGGGGGAILIASSGIINVTGYIYADGGAGAESQGANCGGGGGGGAGGGIRLVADQLVRSGAGYLYARGGSGAGSCASSASNGGAGYIRLEVPATGSFSPNWSQGYADPDYTFVANATTAKLFVPNSPTLTIASVNGIAVPANPTGVADITLAEGTPAVPVVINATNVPVDTSVKIYLVRANGTRSEVTPSPALAGTLAASTATPTPSVTFQPGNTTVMAAVTYTVTELIVASLPRFNGEAVARIRVETEMGGQSRMIYITASGKEYPAAAAQQKKAAT